MAARRWFVSGSAGVMVLAAAVPAIAQQVPRAVPVHTLPSDHPARAAADAPGDPPRSGDEMDWFTIDGGGAMYLTGGAGPGYEMGFSLGQPDAGAMSGDGYSLSGGFWFGAGPAACYANCDHSTVPPILNVNDFVCFMSRFVAADPYANCDGSTTPPVLNVGDFVCFQQAFAAGCP